MKKMAMALGAAMTFGVYALGGQAVAGEGKSLSSVKYDGEIRVRAENVSESDFDSGTVGGSNNFTTQRTRIGLQFEPTNEVTSAYVQLQNTRTYGNSVLTAVDVNETTVHQAYLDTKALGGDVRIGRQELKYGDERLIGSLNWSNVGRSFDGARLRWKLGENNTTDVFGAKVNNLSGVKNDDVNLYGIYSQWKPADNYQWDLYALLRNTREAGTATVGGALPEDRWTLGARGAGKSAGFDYSGEAAFQFGKAGDAENPCSAADNSCDISASAFDLKLGYTWEETASKFRLGIEYAQASGDSDTTDDSIDNFDDLYPTNHNHYGIYDLVSLTDLEMIQINAGGKVSSRSWLGLSWMTFDLDEEVGLTGGVMSEDLGSEIDLLYKFQRDENLGVELGFARLLAGDVIEDTAVDPDDSDWYYAQLTYKF